MTEACRGSRGRGEREVWMDIFNCILRTLTVSRVGGYTSFTRSRYNYTEVLLDDLQILEVPELSFFVWSVNLEMNSQVQYHCR